VRFRWRFCSDQNFRDEGWAIDDVTLYTAPAHDIGAWDVAQVSQADAPLEVSLTVRNFGLNGEPAYQVGWSIDGVPETDAGNSRSLPAGGMDTVTLAWASPVTGPHTLKAWTILPGDGSALNDTLTYSFDVFAAVGVPIVTGWNLISNPVVRQPLTDSVAQLYPASSLNYVYRFSAASGYIQSFRMVNGPGYWGKFPSPGTSFIQGFPLLDDSVSVAAGWNMVGSLSDSVETSGIVSNPPGLVSSGWYGYSGGYSSVTALAPGLAYWVKTGGAGKLYLATTPGPAKIAPGGDVLGTLNRLTITDATGATQVLYFGADGKGTIPQYEMPPAPPEGVFDARFESAQGGTMVRTHPVDPENPVEMPVQVRSVEYPLTLTWNVSGAAQYELGDGMGGQVFASRKMPGEGTMKITSPAVTRVVVKLTSGTGIPTEFSLLQNYPNPFNPSTVIRFGLPANAHVSLRVYNLLGEQVAEAANGVMEAGYQKVRWNGTGFAGTQLASGVYFYRLEAAPLSGGKTFIEVKKMLMLK
jgi:hypothetical protein